MGVLIKLKAKVINLKSRQKAGSEFSPQTTIQSASILSKYFKAIFFKNLNLSYSFYY
tara:strand:+ start:221 stop:391 length:171 start_codon:yes stop_codon:yes gene_type:complete